MTFRADLPPAGRSYESLKINVSNDVECVTMGWGLLRRNAILINGLMGFENFVKKYTMYD